MRGVAVVAGCGRFIKDARVDRNLWAFSKAMAGLCRELDIDTIGEMVEEEATVEFLTECGIPYAQGYLYGKPSPDVFSFAPAKAGATPAKAGGAQVIAAKPLGGGWTRKRSEVDKW